MNLREASGEYSPAIFNWYGILERLGYEVYYEDYAQYDADAFYSLVKETKPAFIFHPTYVKFHTEFARLQEFSKVYCIHSDDDWRFDDYTKYWIPFTDGAIGYQSNLKNYLEAGAREDYYQRARWAFNPNTMLFDFNGKKEYGISHVGGLHGNKAQRVNDMKQKGFDVTCINPNFNSYYGCSSLGRENQVVVNNGRLELDGKPFKAYHFARGGINKPTVGQLFSREVDEFVTQNILN